MTLQERLNLLRQGGVPMPLVGMQELTQAMRLRNAGLSYTTIATVMRTYHGSTRTGNAWRAALRARGAAPRPFGAQPPRRAAR